MPATKNPPAQPPLPKFEDALDELERLANEMENGQAPLHEMLANYKRAATLLHHCRAQLQAVEEQVSIIDSSFAAPSRQEGLA